ncbi:ovoinhibitor-like isoform X3 [Zootermopsis nevadensis]|uniref:ovoinhibitor-like isoform X3 n=1 Tax=Zootermopsis nevadensis TaxID=136037 RepID=UPI000B8E2177|nr:ovoinhibitor-like isoform X3 [Zootermopsis nevadensis]
MIVTSLLVFITAVVRTSSHWHTKGEFICLEAAKNITYDPLCASNNQTFQNFVAFQCFIRYFDVHGLSVRHGACSTNPEPDHCVLSFVVWRPVCGSDNVTYSSVWEMMCEAQRLRMWNSVQYEGLCRAQCTVSLAYKPVCSSENVVYANMEALKCSAMRNPERNVKVRHEGNCRKDLEEEEVVQKQYDPCQEKQNAIASLNRTDQPLFCASDGISYYSSKNYACAVKTNGGWFQYTIIRIGVPCHRSDSPCEKLQVLPEALVADPICGSDGVSYANPLSLMCAMMADQKLKKHHKGECITP